MSATDIFLSYARHDRATARVIADGLSNEGLSVWWDASLHSGETFDEVIERNLKEAKAVVVLWSPSSVASRWVRAEATLADRRNKLIPAIIEECDRPIIFELTHTAELIGWNGDSSDTRWRTFVEDLNRLIKGSVDFSNPRERREPTDAPPAGLAAGAGSSSEARSARQPLRPGSHEVILPNSMRREKPATLSIASGNASQSESEVHCLAIVEGELSEQVIVINSAGMKIGRTAPADIVLAHRSVSREHCIIGIANDELLVTDLNSTNGTFIDEVRINRATILPVGSVLRVGQISMTHAVQRDDDHQRSRPGEPGSGHVGRFAAA